jgi:hypothetical protein
MIQTPTGWIDGCLTAISQWRKSTTLTQWPHRGHSHFMAGQFGCIHIGGILSNFGTAGSRWSQA